MWPVRGTRTLVGLMPAMPLLCDGPRIEPPQSEPMSNDDPPAATIAPAPPDEPDVLRVRSYGLCDEPYSKLLAVLMPLKPPSVNSGVLVLPSRIAPAARTRATTVASFSGMYCWRP